MGALGLLTFILTFILRVSLEDCWFARGVLGAWQNTLQFYNPWDRKWAFLTSSAQLCSDGWDISLAVSPSLLPKPLSSAKLNARAAAVFPLAIPYHDIAREKLTFSKFVWSCLGKACLYVYYLEHERVFGLRAKMACPTFTLRRSNSVVGHVWQVCRATYFCMQSDRTVLVILSSLHTQTFFHIYPNLLYSIRYVCS